MGTTINGQTAISSILDTTEFPAYDAGGTNAGVKVTGQQIKDYLAPTTVSTQTSDYNVPDDGLDYIIPVDTTSNAVLVTLSGTGQRKIKVFDAGENAGTNIITIVGTIDGATNATIEADSGSKEVSYINGAWETTGSFENYFKRNAATGTISAVDPDILSANQIIGGQSATPYTGLYSTDFSNAEANVDTSGGGWGNLLVAGALPFNDGNYNTDNTTPYVITASSVKAGSDQYRVFDGSNVTNWSSNDAVPASVTIDMGTSKIISNYRLRGNTTDSTLHPTAWTLEGSNTGAFAGEETILDTVSGASIATSSWTTLYSTDSLTAFRYIRLNVSAVAGGARVAFAEIDLRESAYATTTNTFQYRPLTSGGSTVFDPSTLVLTDDGDNSIINGEVLIEYSTDNGSTWPGGQRSLNDFTALSAITGTSFWLRFEMVGANLLKQATIQTATSVAEMSSTGLDVRVSGASVGKVTKDGIEPATLTTSERDAISTPASGLLIFNTTTSKLNFYNGSAWEAVTSA